MNKLNKIINFYINASIHVAVAIFCLLKITSLSYQITISSFYYLVVFFGSICSYNFLKYYTVFNKTKKYKLLLWITFLTLLLCLLFYIKLTYAEQKGLFVGGILVGTYPYLRKIGWLKLVIVSFVVSLVTLGIPFFIANRLDFLLFIQRVLILFALLVPFEILDSASDNKKMQTLPQRFGIEKTKIFGYLAILLFIFLEFNCSMNTKKGLLFLVNLFISFITVLIIFFTSTKRSRYYTLFWVESIPIFWCVLLLLLKKISSCSCFLFY